MIQAYDTYFHRLCVIRSLGGIYIRAIGVVSIGCAVEKGDHQGISIRA